MWKLGVGLDSVFETESREARFAAGVWKKVETGSFCDEGGFWEDAPLGSPLSMSDLHPESMW
jgi:hypothetical protein